MQYDYEMEVLGKPRPQGRPRAGKRGNSQFTQIYEDSKDTDAKNVLAVVLRQEAPKHLLSQAIQVDLFFYMARPKSHYRTGKYSGILKDSAPTLHIKKPDIDNLRKLTMDAMTGVWWTDDSIVCKGFTQKYYSDKPRTEIKIKLLD